MQIEISDTTAKLIIEARKRRVYFEEETDDGIIFNVLTEWLGKDGEQSLNDWIRDFF